MFRYRICWSGPWDGTRPERVLTLSAKNKKEAETLHSRLFPIKRRTVKRIARAK